MRTGRVSRSQALLQKPSGSQAVAPSTPDFWRHSLKDPERERFLREWVASRRSDLLEELCHLNYSADSHRASEIKGEVAMLDDLFGKEGGGKLYESLKEWIKKHALD